MAPTQKKNEVVGFRFMDNIHKQHEVGEAKCDDNIAWQGFCFL